MKHSSFFWFVLPSAILMILFIALPIVSVVTQSLYTQHDQVIVTVENCGPFGCTEAQSSTLSQLPCAAQRSFSRFCRLS